MFIKNQDIVREVTHDPYLCVYLLRTEKGVFPEYTRVLHNVFRVLLRTYKVLPV